MEQALVRRLKEGTLGPYRAVAKAKGRSLEAELRDLIERNTPKPVKDSAALVELSRRLRAMTATDVPQEDSTAVIRRYRDRGYGSDIDDDWVADSNHQ